MSRTNTYPFVKMALDTAHAAQEDAQRAKNKLEHFTGDTDRLFLVMEALWLILKKEHGYTDEVLVEMIKEIDLRDGKLSGAAPKPSGQICPNCGKPTSGKQYRCIYCDQPVAPNPFAR